MVKETPEEKLLRIIESTRPDGKPLEPHRAPLGDRDVFKQEIKAASVAFFKSKTFLGIVVGLAVIGGVVILKGYFSKPVLLSLPELKSKDIVSVMPKEVKSSTPAPEEKFAPVVPKAVEPIIEIKSEVFPVQPAVTIASLIKNFRMVGIIWSNAPQVMIEDVSERRTYLLNQGNMLKGVVVKEILKDRVVLSYDNQETELR